MVPSAPNPTGAEPQACCAIVPLLGSARLGAAAWRCAGCGGTPQKPWIYPSMADQGFTSRAELPPATTAQDSPGAQPETPRTPQAPSPCCARRRHQTFLSFFLCSLVFLFFFFQQKFSLSEVFQGRWRESRKPKRIILLVKAFNNYF